MLLKNSLKKTHKNDYFKIYEYLDKRIQNNVKEGSRIVYRDAIRMYIDPYIGNYQLNKYKPADHQKFINSLFTNKELGKIKTGLVITQ